MLDIKAQSQFADATADMMRACAIATTRAASTSMVQSMSFWTRMLQSSAMNGSSLVFPAAWATWSATQEHAPSLAPQVRSPPDTGIASYRSAGGHAVAQVIMGSA
jgi:hypothetical protein